MNRETLERELVTFDKQKVITQCMKLFDSNAGLVNETIRLKGLIDEVIILKAEHMNEVKRLNKRTLWQVLNERIQARIDSIRFRNGGAVKLRS